MKAWHLLASVAAHAVVIGAAAVLCLSLSKPDEIVIPISVELVEPSAEAEPAPSEQKEQAEPTGQVEPHEQPEEQGQPEAQPEAVENLDDMEILEEPEALEILDSLEPLENPETLEPLEQLETPEPLEQIETIAPPKQPAPPKPETAPAVGVEQAKVVSDPVALNRIVPVYPRHARRKGHEGSVVVEAYVAMDGAVNDAKVVSSSGHGELDDAAIDAVRKAKFSPATENGVSVGGRLRLTIDFKLEK